MKKFYLFLFVLGIMTFVACESGKKNQEPNQVAASVKDSVSNTMPSDEKILQAIYYNYGYPDGRGNNTIEGKIKISDHQYDIYTYNHVNGHGAEYSVHTLLKLDNDKWLITVGQELKRIQ